MVVGAVGRDSLKDTHGCREGGRLRQGCLGEAISRQPPCTICACVIRGCCLVVRQCFWVQRKKGEEEAGFEMQYYLPPFRTKDSLHYTDVFNGEGSFLYWTEVIVRCEGGETWWRKCKEGVEARCVPSMWGGLLLEAPFFCKEFFSNILPRKIASISLLSTLCEAMALLEDISFQAYSSGCQIRAVKKYALFLKSVSKLDANQ